MNDDPRAPPPDLLQVALEAARADLPSRDELSSIARGLPLRGAPSGGQAGGAPPAVPSALPGAIVGALLGLVVVAGGMAWEASRVGQGAPAPEGPAALPVAEAPSAAPAARESAPRGPAPRRPERPEVRANAAVASSSPPPGEAPPGAEASEDAGAAGAEREVAAAEETEAQLLQRALATLGRSPGDALEVLGVHQRRFPSGALAQEREVLAVDALLRLGRREEARARAARFAEAYPGSAHRRRVEALLGE